MTAPVDRPTDAEWEAADDLHSGVNNLAKMEDERALTAFLTELTHRQLALVAAKVHPGGPKWTQWLGNKPDYLVRVITDKLLVDHQLMAGQMARQLASMANRTAPTGPELSGGDEFPMVAHPLFVLRFQRVLLPGSRAFEYAFLAGAIRSTKQGVFNATTKCTLGGTMNVRLDWEKPVGQYNFAPAVTEVLAKEPGFQNVRAALQKYFHRTQLYHHGDAFRAPPPAPVAPPAPAAPAAPAPIDYAARHEAEWKQVADAVASFPPTFGLRAFPGDTFRAGKSMRDRDESGPSYMGDDKVVRIYTQRLGDDGKWSDFSKGTPHEVRAQMTMAPARAAPAPAPTTMLAARAFKRPRTLAELKADPRIHEVWEERESSDDPWWATLASGWIHDGEVHDLHEHTIAELCAAMDRVDPCDCDDCLNPNNGRVGKAGPAPVPSPWPSPAPAPRPAPAPAPAPRPAPVLAAPVLAAPVLAVVLRVAEHAVKGRVFVGVVGKLTLDAAGLGMLETADGGVYSGRVTKSSIDPTELKMYLSPSQHGLTELALDLVRGSTTGLALPLH